MCRAVCLFVCSNVRCRQCVDPYASFLGGCLVFFYSVLLLAFLDFCDSFLFSFFMRVRSTSHVCFMVFHVFACQRVCGRSLFSHRIPETCGWCVLLLRGSARLCLVFAAAVCLCFCGSCCCCCCCVLLLLPPVCCCMPVLADDGTLATWDNQVETRQANAREKTLGTIFLLILGKRVGDVLRGFTRRGTC